jgi:hypothetical protein
VPLTGEARWITAASKLKVTGSHLGWMSMEVARSFWPRVLVSTVRPTTTRRSLRGIPPGTPTKSTQWAAVRTSKGVIRLPPQYWRWKSLFPKDWARSAAWNLYFPLGTAVPPTILGGRRPAPGTRRAARP